MHESNLAAAWGSLCEEITIGGYGHALQRVCMPLSPCRLLAQNHDLHLMGALSCCSTYQPRWDSWGRLAQQSTAYVPWNTIAGKKPAERASVVHDAWLTGSLVPWPPVAARAS